MQNIWKWKRIFSIIMMILLLLGCTNDDNDRVSVSILAIKINDAVLNDEVTNVSLNPEIEIAFNASIDPSKFEELFSISNGDQNIEYNVDYSNVSSKAVVSPDQLEANITYNLSVSSGPLGANGSYFSEGINLSFTTNFGKSPCLNASNNCLQTLQISNNNGGLFDFNMYSNYDFVDDPNFIYNSISQLVIVVHGQERNADDYFSFMSTSLQSLDLESTTLLISPFFKDNSTSTNNDLYWDTRWREGANSGNTNASISSFTVIDEIIGKILGASRFPNLKTIIIAGHSSGAAFVQHYALANKIENLYANVNFEYAVANNQYYYYPDDLRYDENTLQFITPTDCSGYNYWPYGYEFAVPYLNGIDKATITNQHVTRSTTYLLGSNDTSTTGSLNTVDCQATLLGSNRVMRGENIFRYMQTYYGATSKHEKVIVNNVGHNANAMFNSQEFKDYLTGKI